jgi:hypothetical protein
MQATTAPTPRTKAATGPGWGLVLVLAALLAVQIALALVLGLRGAALSPAGKDDPLLTLDPAKVERIRIAQRGSDPVVLERTEKGWQLPSLADFPAAAGRVEALLQRLADLKRGLPVATSQDALARLKVADEDHEGRLSLEGGGNELAALYLGEAAGVRRRYVRAAGEGAVHEAELSLTDIPAKADDWADRALLNLDERDIQRIELPDATLERAEGGWRLVDASEGETLDQPKIEELVRRLRGLTFVSVLGAEDKPEYSQDAPALEWRVGLASGDTLSYRLSRLKTEAEPAAPAPDVEAEAEAPKPKGPEWYVLKVSDRPYYLKLAAFSAEALIGTNRGVLLVKPEPSPAEAPGTPPQGGDTPAGAATASDPEARAGGQPNSPDAAQ